jgi:hypothetical protein
MNVSLIVLFVPTTACIKIYNHATGGIVCMNVREKSAFQDGSTTTLIVRPKSLVK